MNIFNVYFMIFDIKWIKSIENWGKVLLIIANNTIVEINQN